MIDDIAKKVASQMSYNLGCALVNIVRSQETSSSKSAGLLSEARDFINDELDKLCPQESKPKRKRAAKKAVVKATEPKEEQETKPKVKTAPKKKAAATPVPALDDLDLDDDDDDDID